MNGSMLERLPYDVFMNVIQTSDMTGKDLIHLCNSSPFLNEYCNRSLVLPNGDKLNQYLFRILLQNKYNINLPSEANPREEYRRVVIGDALLFRKLKEILEVIGSGYDPLPDTLYKPYNLYQLFSFFDIIKTLNNAVELPDLFGTPVKDYPDAYDIKQEIENLTQVTTQIESLINLINSLLQYGKHGIRFNKSILFLSEKEFEESKGLSLRASIQLAKDQKLTLLHNGIKEIKGRTRNNISLFSEVNKSDASNVLDLSIDEIITIINNYENVYTDIVRYESQLVYERRLKSVISNKIEHFLRVQRSSVESSEEKYDPETFKILMENFYNIGRLTHAKESFDSIIDYVLELFNKVLNGKLKLSTLFDEESLL